MELEPVFFHVDMDAFFASVEQREHPEYRGKCLIVGGTGPRSVASTCSYEARKYGVHSAMPMTQALRLCPHAIVVPGHISLYSKVSHQIMKIFEEFSPDITQVSIDEAFLDMTGTRRLYGLPRDTARLLKQRVKEETQLTISVGIGPSRFIAKLASDYRKPDGLCRISPGREIEFIDAIGLKKLWGIGKSTLDALAKYHIGTAAQLREYSMETLQRNFGQAQGEYLYKVCRGIDPGMHAGEAKSHSISSEQTFPVDVSDEDILSQCLLQMSHEVMFRSLDEQVMGRTVGIKLRFSDFTTISVQRTPTTPLYSAEQVYEISKELLLSKWKQGVPVRLLGVGLYQTYKGDAPIQEELFEDANKKKREIEKVVLKLNSKGREILKATNMDGYVPGVNKYNQPQQHRPGKGMSPADTVEDPS